MEELIRQAFVHVEDIGPHVLDGHYDLFGPNGDILLPQVWERMIEPDWVVTMQMWPMPEPPPAPPAPEPAPPHRADFVTMVPTGAQQGPPRNGGILSQFLQGGMPQPRPPKEAPLGKDAKAAGVKKKKQNGGIFGIFAPPPPKKKTTKKAAPANAPGAGKKPVAIPPVPQPLLRVATDPPPRPANLPRGPPT
jgi:hypothetical protein